MNINKVNPQLLLYGAGAIALLFVVYKMTKATGDALDTVTSAPGKALDAVERGAGSVYDWAKGKWNDATGGSEPDVAPGTVPTQRINDTARGATFGELSGGGSLAWDDPRYYGNAAAPSIGPLQPAFGAPYSPRFGMTDPAETGH